MNTPTLNTLYRYIVFVLVSLFTFTVVKAQTETLTPGSFIINMGATNPNTISNGLKPYGLIYDVMRNYKVPVKWVIGQTKIKDGADFTYNAVQYKGGTFIIPAEFRTAAVNARISFWQTQGVVGTTTTTALTLNITYTLTTLPRWTFDPTNGSIAQSYLTNAGITLAAFPGAFNFKAVSLLDCCDDLFVMPHANPTWGTHGRLFSWNRDCRGSIWGACHMVSALENSINPANTTQQMNFLSERTAATAPTPWPNNSLMLWTTHLPGSVPYTHRLFSDPMAQYMGVTDAAQLNGSEQIYIPKQTAPVRWRAGVKVIAYDPSQANVPVVNPDLSNAAVTIIYGNGFDDPTRGLVMYEAGHSHNTGTAGDVAAQRAFLNFSFFQGIPKAPQQTVSGITNGQIVVGGNSINLSVTATSPITGATFSYQWTSTCGGTFSNATAANTTLTAPAVGINTNCIITCTATDNCGRKSFKSFSLTILPPPRPPVTVNDNLSIDPSCAVLSKTINVLSNDSDPDGDLFTLTNLSAASNGTVSFSASGNITYTANPGFYGTEVLTYTTCDNTIPVPLCSTGTLSVTVGNIANVPAAVNDAFTIAEDAISTFNVLANDVPIVSGPITVSAITAAPANGKVSINTDNTITYVPNADFAGIDNFTYRNVNAIGYSKTATVTVTVTNDACDGGTYQSVAGISGSYSQNPLKDSWLDQRNAGRNNGINVSLICDGETNRAGRPLVQFNLSAIPSGATITNANLRLVATAAQNNTAFNLSLHRVTNNWDEGTQNSANGISNWTQRLITGPVLWTTAGGDFNAAAEATTSVTTTGTYNWTGGTLNNMIQNWVNGTNTNYGMLMKFVTEGTGNEAKTFSSNNNGTAANRPLLTFDYTTPATCATIPARAPLALPDTATTNSTTAISIPVTTNDALFGQAVTSLTISTAPSTGSATVVGNNIQYTPSGTFNGIATLQYTVTTANGNDIVKVYINVTNTPVNANDDAPAAALSGTVQTINVKANDVDPENAALTVAVVTAPVNGTATVNGTGNIVYTPNAGFTGNDTLFYSVCEPATLCGISYCDTARVVLIVQNRVPVAVNDTKTVLPCQDNIVVVLANDTDPENGVLTVNITTPPVNGTASVNTDGTITYRANAGFTGTDNFNYTVTDNGVTPLTSLPATISFTIPVLVNHAPFANSDYADTTNMDEVLYYSVSDNDTDPDGHNLNIPTITVQPLHGTASALISGIIQYIPNPGFYGADTLIYQVCDMPVDPASCSSFPPLCDTAKMFIYIKPINIVVAVNDENSTLVNTAVTGTVLTNDSDPDEGNPVTFRGFMSAGLPVSSGSITVSGVDDTGTPVANAGTLLINTNGKYIYTPAAGFTGVMSVPNLIEDANPNTAVDSAVLMITVTPNISITNSVIANNDENTTLGNPVSSSLFLNDTDPQGNSFSLTSYKYDTNGDGIAEATGTIGTAITTGGITETGMPVNNAGTLLIQSNGNYTYTPAPDFHGYIDVPYSITDVLGAQSFSLLHIDVLSQVNGALNDSPFAGDDFSYTNVNTPVTSSFVNNDGDPNGNPVSLGGITINTAGAATPIGGAVATAKGGTMQFFANGTYAYMPPSGYVGADSVGYTICDVTVINPQPLCANAFIHLLIGVGNNTDAINDENSTWQDMNVSSGVLANDFDKENNTQTFGSFLLQNLSSDMTTGAAINGVDKTGTPVANAGTLTFDATGNYTFDPAATFTGIISVPYKICDNGNQPKCDTAYLTITVDPLPTTGINTVIANNDENISYGNAVSNNLFVNDKDPQNDLFTVTAVTGGTAGSSFTVAGTDLNGNTVANAGTLIINTNGSYTYNPGGFTGSINVPYTITDALGAVSTAALNIDVLSNPNGPSNDPPFAGDDFSYTTINKLVTGNFINNDSDPNGNPVSIAGTTIVPGGAHTAIGSALPTIMGGNVQFYADGTYNYAPPAGYIGPDAINYTICDVTAVTPQPLCANAQIQLLIGPGISITGKVWDDANGNVIDPGASEPETNIGGTLFVNLVNGAGNITGTVAVANDGTYNFNNVTPGTDYTLMLSTIQGTVGQPAPAAVLPAAWANTGETRNGTIDLGTAGIIDTRTYGFTNVINFNFGIEQLPNSFDVIQSVSQPVVGQLITLNGGANPPIPSGSDAEDGALGTGNTIVITTLPANSNLLYNGVAVTAGQGIGNFDPSLLQIEITAATVGAINTSFQFAYVDAASKQDPTQATYNINWLSPLPIKLESFTAAPQDNSVILKWVVSDEINVAKYEIESSTAATNFISIGNINANSNRNYSMLHTTPVIGFNYYRLKTTDKDGRISYSDVRKVNFGKGGTVNLYPNPAAGFVNITLASAMINKPGIINILSAEGKVVFQKHSNALSQIETIAVNNLAAGKYIVQIFTDKGIITRPLEIIR
jgi:Bacterial Ig domain/Secretion system C-terminal sorting domain/Bacterial cadherin-like domain